MSVKSKLSSYAWRVVVVVVVHFFEQSLVWNKGVSRQRNRGASSPLIITASTHSLLPPRRPRRPVQSSYLLLREETTVFAAHA